MWWHLVSVSLPHFDITIVSRSSKTGSQDIPFDPLYLSFRSQSSIQNRLIKLLYSLYYRIVKQLASHDVLNNSSPNNDSHIFWATCNQMEASASHWCPLNVVNHPFMRKWLFWIYFLTKHGWLLRWNSIKWYFLVEFLIFCTSHWILSNKLKQVKFTH